ncbi:unnamed protein product [Rodentolepis nana]|uniref:Uncharacterized protein n=1 Tax=Rodentolepis nana TaxID=102285 RepID=A0A3P7V561_RODNA|nr:unnamed protein product [Rodentolepis nana]
MSQLEHGYAEDWPFLNLLSKIHKSLLLQGTTSCVNFLEFILLIVRVKTNNASLNDICV